MTNKPIGPWIERNGCSMRLREDRRVDVYGPAGYRVVNLNSLLPSIQIALQDAKEANDRQEKLDRKIIRQRSLQV